MTALFDATETATESQCWTEAKMLDLLRQKYTRVRPYTDADRYVRAAHVPRPSGYGMAQRIADYLVLDTYTPQRLIGFEVKVSRSDWLVELRNPLKADEWRRYCHQWFLVVPDMAIVREELPPGWGAMSIDKTGALRVRQQSPAQEPLPMPLDVLCQFSRSVAKTATREAVSRDGE